MTFELLRYKNNPLLTADKKHPWEAGAVFNPCVLKEGRIFHMLYRAVAAGFKPKPGGGYTNYVSSIGYAISKDGVNFKRFSQPLIRPDSAWERFGCEDPRITKFQDTYYILYTALSRPAYSQKEGVRIALATTKDFKIIRKHGIIGPDLKSKAAALFPEKISNRLIMLFTLFPDSVQSAIYSAGFKTPTQLLRPPKDYWKKFIESLDQSVVLPTPKNAYRGPEVGAPPLKTSRGWLLIYCGSSIRREWSISGALVDLKDPNRVIAKSKTPILKPKLKYELEGLVPNVTFPEGAVIVGNKLYVYYGGADAGCCLATCKLSDLLKSLM